MAEKSRDAFRTISEVADWLDVPTHVLRFWESRFSQIKPVKRAGGRRYYRPSDMRVIGGVKVLLHDQGMTIRGVQKLFREEGIKHVSGYAPRLFGEVQADNETRALNEEALERAARPAAAARTTREAEPDPDDTPEPVDDDEAGATADAVMFRRSAPVSDATDTTDAHASSAPDAEPHDPVGGASDMQDAAPELPILAIPDTPDVPATDPADDAADHARDAGPAARLRLIDPAGLAANREVLAAAAERLRALADRPD